MEIPYEVMSADEHDRLAGLYGPVSAPFSPILLNILLIKDDRSMETFLDA